MVAPHRKNLLKSRRRVQDDGEEEDGSMAAEVEEDSLSETSAISDADDDADGEGSDGDDAGSPIQESTVPGPVTNGHRNEPEEISGEPRSASTNFPLSTDIDDTEAMMNGLKVSGIEDEGVDFENMGNQSEVQPSSDVTQGRLDSSTTENFGDKRRREHEEYKKKRDADPAFVPNRGGFFMHDHRSAAPGQSGFRPFARGRGRGRGGLAGPLQPSSHPSGPADSPWSHDLHETVTEPNIQTASEQPPPLASNIQHPAPAGVKSQPPNRSFSRTIRIGQVQIRVFLRDMTDPIVFSAVPVHQHTRLPHHRPPLRRDKPVRISLPEFPIRYIFPSADRSFIFIPRALRPNQQGFGKLRGRGSLGGGYNAFGGLSSRRTSGYAGSAYSPSVTMSRRSSLAREVAIEGVMPSTGAAASRMPPVVRLPPAAEQLQQPNIQLAATDTSTAPTVNLPQSSAYPLPQKPALRENRPGALPMQHPKPQRTLQVADIDSPATLEFNPPQQQQQLPFHQQVPTQITGQSYQVEFPHSRHPSHPSQASGGTPLPQVPERAIHAQPFQPYPYQHPQPCYPQPYPPPMYYYPPPEQVSDAPSAAAAAFVPGQQYHYPLPYAPVPAPVPAPAPQAQQPTESNTQSRTVAQEINGMVYYLDSSQIAAGAENPPPYPPASYPMPPPGGVVGMGGMMTPPMYYPPQPPPPPPPPPPPYYPQQ
ncbi:hypothetical protein ACLMJK_000509 [Lecanora helva]